MRIPCGKRPLKTSTIFGSMLKNVQGQIQILTSKFVFLCNMIDVWFRIPKCISKQFNCAFDVRRWVGILPRLWAYSTRKVFPQVPPQHSQLSVLYRSIFDSPVFVFCRSIFSLKFVIIALLPRKTCRGNMQTKNFQQLQTECRHVGLHVHYRNSS